VEKIVEREKDFGKKTVHPTGENMCLALKGRINHMILLEEKVVREDMERRISEAGDRHNQGERLKKIVHPTGDTMCLALKGKNQSHDSSREEDSKRGRGKKRQGVGIIEVRYLIFTVFVVARMDMRQRLIGSHGRRSKKRKNKRKKNVMLLKLILLFLIAILA
jgi:hypothetical protein